MPSSGREYEEKDWYTTGEAAKILGVSFRTIKRWIYSGKIKTTRTAGGHYRISNKEIERLRSEVEDQFAIDIITLIEKRKVAYFREVQINLEDKYRHYETRDTSMVSCAQKGLFPHNGLSSRIVNS